MQGHNKTCILLSRVMPLREPDAGPNLASHFRSLGSCLGASIPRTLSMNHSSERHRFITRQHMAWCSISLKLRFARQTPIRRRCPWDPPSPFEELIPFSSRASILFLLEDVKLARLILSYAVFLLRSYAWESQPGDSYGQSISIAFLGTLDHRASLQLVISIASSLLGTKWIKAS